jgi:hypothetical protein
MQIERPSRGEPKSIVFGHMHRSTPHEPGWELHSLFSLIALLLVTTAGACTLDRTNPYDPAAEVTMSMSAPLTIFPGRTFEVLVDFEPARAVYPQLTFPRYVGPWPPYVLETRLEPGRVTYTLIHGSEVSGDLLSRVSFGSHSVERRTGVLTPPDRAMISICGAGPVRVGQTRAVNVTLFDDETAFVDSTNCKPEFAMVYQIESMVLPETVRVDSVGSFTALAPGRARIRVSVPGIAGPIEQYVDVLP